MKKPWKIRYEVVNTHANELLRFWNYLNTVSQKVSWFCQMGSISVQTEKRHPAFAQDWLLQTLIQ